MNAQQMIENLKAHSNQIRQIIRNARVKHQLTEESVNQLYHSTMARRGLSAPKAIMTKVRDKRRDFILNSEEAECMATALSINVQPLLPPEAPQQELPMAPESLRPPKTLDTANASVAEPIQPYADRNPQIERPGIATSNNKTPDPLPSPTPARPETEGVAKISVGFYETSKGLRFHVNKALTQNQFDRLTLAIPEYMMQVEKIGDNLHCRANVPIFDYQAELLTRAIFGAK